MTIYSHSGEELTEADIDAPALSRAARQSQRSSGYGGLRVDEYGRDADGVWYPQYDGGGQ